MDELPVSPYEFQDVIGKFINKMGFTIESSELLTDGSVDFISKTTNPMGGSILSLIRASAYTRLVSEDDINNLDEAMKRAGAVRAAYITTSGFSEEAVEAAKDKPIREHIEEGAGGGQGVDGVAGLFRDGGEILPGSRAVIRER